MSWLRVSFCSALVESLVGSLIVRLGVESQKEEFVYLGIGAKPEFN